ncbi:MAG: ABC transporter permease [Thermoleophilia bacterium]|nr:ABC transporter permease [Thermoleophilia bacterium]
MGGLALMIAGLDPVDAYRAVLDEAVGSSFGIRSSLLQALPITITALGVALAFRAGLFNLGGEGQIYAGALAAVLVALQARGLPFPVLVPLMLVFGAVAGGLWGGIAGVLRARLGLSEIITTILLNFVAFWMVSYLVRGPIQDPGGAGYPYTEKVVDGARLPVIGDTVPAGVLVLAAVAIGAWALLERSVVGVRLKDVGEGPSAAAFAGWRIDRQVILALVIAGALGGLAGAVELSGNQHRVSDFFTPGWGFDALAVALIGRGTIAGSVAAGVFFGGLRSGIDGAQTSVAVPESVGQIVQGTAVLFLIVANADVAVRWARRIRQPGHGRHHARTA